MSQSYRVDGMTCGGCAASVTKAIEAIGPNVRVEVDLETKQVAVDGFEDEEAIGEAIEAAGFEFGGRV